MNCKVCGSSEFVTNDGITYCTECQSQIEETQTEVAVEPTFSRDIGASGPKKTPTQKKAEYSDWITVECYNQILYMQVTDLIKLGASPKLKSTVLHIWTKYLQKCEIAFRVDYQAKDAKPCLGPAPSKRDLNILSGNKQISARKRKKPEDSDVEPSANLSTDVEPCSNLSTDEDYLPSAEDSDTKSETKSTSSVSTEDSCSKVKYSSHARKLQKKKRLTRHNRKKKVFNMTLEKTLSFCYLGLLYTEDQLSLCDLIRFAYEEKIPYVNIVDKLPSTMKLAPGDYSTFHRYSVPGACTISKTSREIMQFLKLPQYKEPSIFLITARLVKDLNLPSDILPIIKTLLERYREQMSRFRRVKKKSEIIPPEHQVLALMLVAMKLLFILDDKFEIEHSITMNKLNTLYPDRRYFEWKEWMEHSMVKEYLFLCENPSYSPINNLDSLSADAIISKYPFTRISSTPSEEPRHYFDVAHVKHKINKFLSGIVDIPNSNPNIPTSFPLTRAVKCFMEEWKTLPMFKETKEIDFTILKKDFSSWSLSFNPLQFDKTEDELSHLLMTSLYLPNTTVNVGLKYYVPTTFHHRVINTTSSYWLLTEKYYGRTDVSSDWLEKLPTSFKWLLNFFSKYAYCKSYELYEEVVKIEKILFLQKHHVINPSLYKDKINIDF